MTICIDFDGVLHSYVKFKGVDVFDDALPEAANAVKYLRSRGHTLILHTTRPITDKLRKWLEDHGMVFDYFNENPHTATGQTDPRKPLADMYIDDRAIRFRGNWRETVSEVEAFTPWYKKGATA